MSDLPYTVMYALRHGQTGKIWQAVPGWWLFKSVADMQRTWKTLRACGLVGSDFHEHTVITIQLSEVR